MSLKTDLNAAVVGIFNDFASLTVAATYVETLSAQPIAGGRIAESTVEYSCDILISGNGQFGDEYGGDTSGNFKVANESIQVLIAVAAINFVPKTEGVLVFKDKSHKIQSVDTDPSDSIYTITVRA